MCLLLVNAKFLFIKNILTLFYAYQQDFSKRRMRACQEWVLVAFPLVPLLTSPAPALPSGPIFT